MTTEQHPIFVYGTLLPGQPNAHLWQAAALSTETAVFENGRLYDMGFYPMLTEEPGSHVNGIAITLMPEEYEAGLTVLDRLEGYDPARPNAPGYRRVLRRVRLTKNGHMVRVWIYVGEPAALAAGYPSVPGGDWLAHSAKKREEVSNWWTDIDSILGVYG